MAATPFKLTGTGVYVDAAGNPIPGILPVSLNMSASDVAEAAVTFDDYDADKGFTVPTVQGAIGLRLMDLIATADGVDTKKLQLKAGTAPTTIILRDSLLATLTGISPETRMQGINGVVLGTGQRYGFIQKA